MADSGLPNRLCQAIADWLREGQEAGKFIIHGEDIGEIAAEAPRFQGGKYPKAFVVWSAFEPRDYQICAPAIHHQIKFLVQVRLYNQDPSNLQLTKDMRDLAWAMYEHLRLNRTFGLAADCQITRVSGDVEYLLRQGILASGIIEMVATIDEAFVKEV